MRPPIVAEPPDRIVLALPGDQGAHNLVPGLRLSCFSPLQSLREEVGGQVSQAAPRRPRIPSR